MDFPSSASGKEPTYQCRRGFPGGSVGRNPPAIQDHVRYGVWFLGWEDPVEEGMGNLLQYSCLENPMDRGAGYSS